MLTVAFTAREIRVTRVAFALATVALLAVLTCVACKPPLAGSRQKTRLSG